MQKGRTGSCFIGWCLWSFLAREVPTRLLCVGLITCCCVVLIACRFLELQLSDDWQQVTFELGGTVVRFQLLRRPTCSWPRSCVSCMVWQYDTAVSIVRAVKLGHGIQEGCVRSQDVLCLWPRFHYFIFYDELARPCASGVDLSRSCCRGSVLKEGCCWFHAPCSQASTAL